MRNLIHKLTIASSLALASLGCYNQNNEIVYEKTCPKEAVRMADLTRPKEAVRMADFGLTKTLVDFLTDKNVKIKFEDEDALQISAGGALTYFAGGSYSQLDNVITFPRKYSPKTINHEVGHALWDCWGEDSIFDNFFSDKYSGPSRQDFINAMKGTIEYQKERGIILERFADSVYSSLIKKFESSEKEKEIHRVYEDLIFNKKDYDGFLDYTVSLGLDVDKNFIDGHALSETFAVSFGNYMIGKKTQFDDLFNSMSYNGRSLREK